MSITISTDVFCDEADCSQWIAGEVGPRSDAKGARKVAKRCGWKITARRDLCPKCAALQPPPPSSAVQITTTEQGGGAMGDVGDFWNDLKENRRDLRLRLGRECPVCREKRPKTNPSILLPGQRCKVDGYRDPRPREEPRHD